MNLLIIVLCAAAAVCASSDDKIEYYLETFLDLYYEKHLRPDGGGHGTAETSRDEGMQSDQPADDNAINPRFNNTSYYTTDYDRNLENRNRENDGEEHRDKNYWTNKLKTEILMRVGRINATVLPQRDNLVTHNISQHVMQSFSNIRNQSIDYYITEKIRTFYPSCDLPKDHDVKKDENTMTLFVNVDQLKGNLSSATLRLYRANTTLPDGDVDEENRYRVTVYFLAKPRRNKVKKKMCDAKVVKETQYMTELNVAPAVKAWSEGKNLGLIVQVEDQDDRMIRADSFFNGCIYGSSTPKPIPSILFDASSQHQPPTIPTIDICMLEIPENYTGSYNVAHACSLLRLSAHPLPPPLPVIHQQPARHIRHQRQHQRDTEDPRSHIVQRKVIITNEELQSLNATESSPSR